MSIAWSLGEAISQQLQGGALFVLEGPGGSGKSVVSKALAKHAMKSGVFLGFKLPVPGFNTFLAHLAAYLAEAVAASACLSVGKGVGRSLATTTINSHNSDRS